jgi:hypothetical protein
MSNPHPNPVQLPLPSGERAGVRGIASIATAACPHPNPLPEGEGTNSEK